MPLLLPLLLALLLGIAGLLIGVYQFDDTVITVVLTAALAFVGAALGTLFSGFVGGWLVGGHEPEDDELHARRERRASR